MTKSDKIFLIHFILRTGMYINPVDIHNIQSFITGYEVGRKGKCNFYELCKRLLSEKYKMKYSSDGVLGQINRLSKRQSISNIVTFNKIAIDAIATDGLDAKARKILNSSIGYLISMVDKVGHPSYNEKWKDNWLSFVSLNNEWFKHLWTKEELLIIKSINKEVLIGNIFGNQGNKIPSENMLKLKEKFDKTNCT